MTKKQIIQAIRDHESALYTDLRLHKETDRVLDREKPSECTTHARSAWAAVWRLLQTIEGEG